MSGLVQHLVIYALVLWCVWRLLRKYLPSWSWQSQARLSFFLETRHSAWIRRLGRHLRPAPAIPQGCDTHCNACRKCS